MMKQLFAILLLFNLATNAKSSDTDGETRTATLTYDVSANDEIDLRAKYTDVSIEAWDRQEVQITATIRFDGKMTNKMQEFLDNFEEEVRANIMQSATALEIRTNLDEPNKVQIGGKSVGIVIGFNEDELKLSYALKIPASNEIKIQSSYRDLSMKGSFADVTIDQYSGDLEVESIAKAKMKLKYGTAEFKTIEDAEMELYEQELNGDEITKLEINTKYSELTIKQLGATTIESYESDFELEDLEFMEGNLKYGKMEVSGTISGAELTTYEFDIEANQIQEFKFENTKYGKFEAEKVGQFNIVQSYETDYDLTELGSLKAEESKYSNYEIGTLNDSFELWSYEGEVSIDQVGSEATRIFIDGKYVDVELGLRGISYKVNMNAKYGSTNIDRSSSNVTRYIKDGDQLEIEVASGDAANAVTIEIKGYEMDLDVSQ